MSKMLKKRKPCKRRTVARPVGVSSIPARKKRHRREESLEDRVVGLATGGNLAKAARSAIRNQQEKRLPVTFQRGSKIVKQYADGREEVLATVKRSRYKIPQGVIIISSK